jgi:hypothetical protein
MKFSNNIKNNGSLLRSAFVVDRDHVSAQVAGVVVLLQALEADVLLFQGTIHAMVTLKEFPYSRELWHRWSRLAQIPRNRYSFEMARHTVLHHSHKFSILKQFRVHFDICVNGPLK